ncbi:MAG: aminotransferase class V-fold PLP-dependent enzyme, partial [Prevotellaceae bacterium]|nr:aminotransferase class V-fold PLP-dependent enzyme [Prevotellaceae bacterium]
MLDTNAIRDDFPLLSRRIYNRPLIYLDNAATTQKPRRVIEKEREVYETLNSNIHRSVSRLGALCTEKYEEARSTVREFIGAESPREVIFTSGTTAAINLLASSFGERFVERGDEIIVGESEHHSNIVPWQMLCQRKGAILKTLPFDNRGDLRTELLDSLLSDRTRLVCVASASNVLGTVNPLALVTAKAHAAGAYVLVDGAQGIQHLETDVKREDWDFYVFSGHKVYAPTGIGVLYGKERLLDLLPPWQGGGDMVKSVTFKETLYADLPLKFEAGTANYVGAIALAEALQYLADTGLDDIRAYERDLTDYALRKLSAIDGLRIFGTSTHKVGIA